MTSEIQKLQDQLAGARGVHKLLKAENDKLRTALKSALPIIGGVLSEAKDSKVLSPMIGETIMLLQKIYDDAEAAISKSN